MLTDQQRQHLEKRLIEERERVVRDLQRFRASSGSESQQDKADDLTLAPFHPADLGTDTIDQELDASNAARQTNELTEIDAALERLRRTPDRFGMCEDTGEPIPFERLDLVPWARFCNERY